MINQPKENLPNITEIGSIEVVDRFHSEDNEAEIHHRAQMSKNAMGRLRTIWSDSLINKMLKIRLVNALVFSVLLYASEIWMVREANGQRIDALEMWCW